MKEGRKSLEEISPSIIRHYDLLTDEEKAENHAWGEFAAANLAGSKIWAEWQDEANNELVEGTSEIQRSVIARPLLKE